MDRRIPLLLVTGAAAAIAWFLLKNERFVVVGQEDQPRRCAGITQGGSRCTREAEPGSPYCWQHG